MGDRDAEALLGDLFQELTLESTLNGLATLRRAFGDGENTINLVNALYLDARLRSDFLKLTSAAVATASVLALGSRTFDKMTRTGLDFVLAPLQTAPEPALLSVGSDVGALLIGATVFGPFKSTLVSHLRALWGSNNRRQRRLPRRLDQNSRRAQQRNRRRRGRGSACQRCGKAAQRLTRLFCKKVEKCLRKV